MSQSANSGANTLRKPTILVVEDDPSWHLLYKLWFEPKYQIIIATSFATAIGPLLNQEPVVVITDLKLEDPLEPENRHGRHILNVAYALSIPTIVVSGLLTESLRTQLPIYYGVVYVLDKVANEEVPPFSHRLKTCVEKITSGATTRKPTPSSKEGDHKDDWGKLVSQAHFWESVGDKIGRAHV